MLVRGLDPDIAATRDQLLEDWAVDDELFCYDVLSETFEAEFTPLHDEIFRAIRGDSHYKLVLAPRGLGKTSICRSIVIKAILYREKHFIVYASNSLTLAEMQTENIKRELLSNKVIRKVWGDVRECVDVPDWAFVDESFSKKAWVAWGSCLILPRGLDQQFRGLNWNNWRPDLIILDDVEKKDELNNEEMREKNTVLMLGDIMECGSRLRKDTDFIYLDTLKHEDALPVRLMEMGGWDWTRLQICDEELLRQGIVQSYAPAFMSNEEIALKLRNLEHIGQGDIFWREYMNVPVGPSTASFKKTDFRYYSEDSCETWKYAGDDAERSVRILLGKIDKQFFENVIIVDPAKTVTPQSCESAIICIGVNLFSHQIIVRDIVSDKLYPDQLYDAIILMKQRWQASAIAVEVTSLNEFITFPLKNELAKRNITNYEFIELKPRAKKEDRVKALIPLYRSGYIYHNPEVCERLEKQLVSFPASRLWDIMDALAYAVELFLLGDRFFSPNFSLMPEVPSKDEMMQAYTDEYGEEFTLDDMEMLV